MNKKTCGKKNEHGPHYHEVELTKECPGKTECGIWSHSKHSYTVTEKVSCPGVCRCDYVSHPHDPSRHPNGKVEA